MQRFLSKKEKPNGTGEHKRNKSKEKTGDKTPGKLILKKSLRFSKSLRAISAAFSNPHGKSAPVLDTTNSTVYTTSADSRPGIFLQNTSSSDARYSFPSNFWKQDPQKKLDKKLEKELEAKISTIKERLRDEGYGNVADEQINHCLASESANGDVDKAFDMLLIFQQSVEGYIKSYNPKVQMQGAENRELVTCYLDALLFAMFARLESFETILHNEFEEEPKRKLATLIRVWVNMLRTGKLIQTDVTKHLQEALAECGWRDAARIEQQDTSEAFSFITETLGLPLLSLKVDIFHVGTDDDPDDHKVVQERLLDVALPEDHDPNVPLKLEDCLENYFNNRIEVTRKIERSDTKSSIRSVQLHTAGQGSSEHYEIAGVAWAESPITLGETSTEPQSPITPITPGGRNRATSFIRRVVEGEADGPAVEPFDRIGSPDSLRKGSIRKEVRLPAWQFYNLLRPSPSLISKPPSKCYPQTVLINNLAFAKEQPAKNDAEVAAHFKEERPVLGICLKRYSMGENGEAKKNGILVDVPLELKLPHFIEEDMISEDGRLMGKFKLKLQGVICHRGQSVNQGHYISYVRGMTTIADGDFRSDQKLSNSAEPPRYPKDRWIKHDDLADPRVAYVDIEQALREETPYLLFYQVLPIIESSVQSVSDLDVDPPAYADSGIGLKISSPADRNVPGYFDGAPNGGSHGVRVSVSSDTERPSRRSMNLGDDRPEERRGSTAMTESSITSTASSMGVSTAITSASDETTVQRISRAASRFAKSGSKSRPTSASGEGRMSTTFPRMGWKISKEQLNKKEATQESVNVPEMLAQTDGLAESARNSFTMEDDRLMPEEATPVPSKSRKGRKRDKSNEPTDKGKGRGKWKDKTQDNGAETSPERECIIM
ncbi:hypothetical protein LSUE1_G008333 [Lachnellula suecica]|uniref:ubiquitinyl hydrolase 1 n=1 Tax=Lachnellula suecica TaxID=602035 RepID=A0A8T9BUL4_9HELO|nr:hypothetical protein LSUE1_G008333 [Lachnellula suecica]